MYNLRVSGLAASPSSAHDGRSTPQCLPPAVLLSSICWNRTGQCWVEPCPHMLHSSPSLCCSALDLSVSGNLCLYLVSWLFFSIALLCNAGCFLLGCRALFCFNGISKEIELNIVLVVEHDFCSRSLELSVSAHRAELALGLVGGVWCLSVVANVMLY